MAVIEIKQLTKFYGKLKALDGVDLEVQPGEVFGFIGPNGAGKTTTIRILLGMLRKDAGMIKLLGGDPWQDAVTLHRRIASVPGDVTLWPDLTGGEVIDLLSRLQGGLAPARRKEMLERFQLDPTKKCRTYSKGNRQKVALVAAFATDADLFILDEPTSGLDPLMELVFREYIAEVKRAGKTVFLSSHILAEVEALCDRVGIIRQGRMVETGTMAELRHLTRSTVTLETARPAAGLEEWPGIHELQCEGSHYRFALDASALPTVMQRLSPLGIVALKVEPATLEELFMRHYGDMITERLG